AQDRPIRWPGLCANVRLSTAATLKSGRMLQEVKQMTTEARTGTEGENELDLIATGEQELAALHARIGPHFRRAEVRERAGRFLTGLLSRVERKNGWQLAEELDESG